MDASQEVAILYNGATGGLGRHVGPAAMHAGVPAFPILSRMEDHAGLHRELAMLRPFKSWVLIQLAARVSIPACEADPEAARQTNVDQPIAVAQSVADWAARTRSELRVVYVSTGHVYRGSNPGNHLVEESPLDPRSVYAATKVEAEEQFSRFGAARGVAVARARVFGLVGPDQPAHYVLPGLIRRVLENDLSPVPGLDNVRDYLDTRDVAANLVTLATAHWTNGDMALNVCSGQPVSIRDLLALTLDVVRGNGAAVARGVAAAPGRPGDIPWLVGDPSRFQRLAGRSAQSIPLRQSASDAAAHAVSTRTMEPAP